jgi:probable rRNA maturation factor
MSAVPQRGRLRVETQFAARRPWVPAAAALRRWASAAHGAALARGGPARGGQRAGRARHGPATPTVCIRVVGARASRRLNREYRGKDNPTNVLSFPASATERELAGSLGDLAICAAVVAAEARTQRKPPAAHWAHMVVHGILHLHGYDHETPRQAQAMEGLEVEILRGFGYQNPYRPVILRDT